MRHVIVDITFKHLSGIEAEYKNICGRIGQNVAILCVCCAVRTNLIIKAQLQSLLFPINV